MGITWRAAIRNQRKKLGLTQTEVANRAGIHRDYLCRLELGSQEPSPALKQKISRLLTDWQKAPELSLCVDYVRLRFPTSDYQSIIENLLHLKMDHLLLQAINFSGYTAKLVFFNIEVMFNPDSKETGTLVELTGKACREFENILLKHHTNWYDFLHQAFVLDGRVSRLDLAINDHYGILDIPQLIQKCKQNECVALMRQFQSFKSGALNAFEASGSTLYIGSLKSSIYFCIYDKAAEQRHQKKADASSADIKNRFEIRLKNKRAMQAAHDLITFKNAERTAFGIINHYLRFVDPGNSENHCKWPTNQRWAQFCGTNRAPVKLTFSPKPFELSKTKDWIAKQVAPTLKMLLEIDKQSGSDETMQLIQKAQLDPKQQKIIDQYLTGTLDLSHPPRES